jgi:hypothetical protein
METRNPRTSSNFLEIPNNELASFDCLFRHLRMAFGLHLVNVHPGRNLLCGGE